MATILFEDECVIPDGLSTLAAFRRWALSEEFPQRGRIDWIASRIEVDMSPEDIFTHGTLKSEIVGCLWGMTKAHGMHLFTGETRISSIEGNLSAEPDVVAVKDEAFETGRVRLVPSAGGKPDRFVELEGGPDLVVEIVSDSSVRKTPSGCPRRITRRASGSFGLSMPAGRRCGSRSIAARLPATFRRWRRMARADPISSTATSGSFAAAIRTADSCMT